MRYFMFKKIFLSQYAPLFAFLAWRLLWFISSIQGNHFWESDTHRWLLLSEQLLTRGELVEKNWNTPGYPLFVALIYHLLGLKHYGILFLHNALDLYLVLLLMREFKWEKYACWAISIFFGMDLACTVYSNSIMSETLSCFFLTLGWYYGFRKNWYFAGGFFTSASCMFRGGNWPLILLFLFFVTWKKRQTWYRTFALSLIGVVIGVGPLITYNGVKYGDWRVASQGDYHWVTLGAGILMREKGISWWEGEQIFRPYSKELDKRQDTDPSIIKGSGFKRALFQYIYDHPKAFLWSIFRGLGTQFIGGLNSEIIHRTQGREIEKEPLPRPIHIGMIAIHATWMTWVWVLFLLSFWRVYREDKTLRPLILYGFLAMVYFYVSVATLGAARFRVPIMPFVAFVIALNFQAIYKASVQKLGLDQA